MSKKNNQIYYEGNVGIGTPKPNAKLHIYEGQIRLQKNHLINQEKTWQQSILFTDEVDRVGAKITAKREKWGGAPIGLHFETGGLNTVSTKFTIKKDGDAWLAGTLTQASDGTLKKDIKTIGSALDKITQLRGIEYKWKDDTKSTAHQLGLVAQEVEIVFPELVTTDHKGHKAVAYTNIIAPLIEAVKELRAEKNRQFTKLEGILKEKEEAIEALKQQVLVLTR